MPDFTERLGEERGVAEEAVPKELRERGEAMQSRNSGLEIPPVRLEITPPLLNIIKESLDVALAGESKFRPLRLAQLVLAGQGLDIRPEEVEEKDMHFVGRIEQKSTR